MRLFQMIAAVFLNLLLLPFFGVAWLGLLVSRLGKALSTMPPEIKFTPLPAKEFRKATIVILNWNGRHLLEENLSSVIQAAHANGGGHEVLVVDNGSADDSVAFLERNYPDVCVLALPRNLGFGEGNNRGVQAAKHPIVVLLNNDMRVEENFLAPLLEGFEEDVFAVSSQINFMDAKRSREETGKTNACFRSGFFQFSHEQITEADMLRRYVPVLWAGGGSSAFHRDRFLWLGGFDSLYSPCYVEDTDLGFRAWKLGWKVLMAPASRVHHQHRASSSRRFSPQKLENLILKNQILFAWVNLYDFKSLFAHAFLFPLVWLKTLLASRHPAWWALPWALLRWPAVIKRRFRRSLPLISDAHVFISTSEKFRFYQSRLGKNRTVYPDRLRILIVTAYLPHLGYHAGAGRMYHLIRRLAQKHEVSVISFLEREEEKEHAESLKLFCRHVHVLMRYPDYIRSLYVYEPFDAFYSQQMRGVILQALEEQDFDLIHYEYAQMGKYFLPDCPIPQLFTEHEVNFAACKLQSQQSVSWFQKLGWYYNYMQVMQREVAICKRMARTICMTEKDALHLAGLVDADRIAVVRTGVDLDYFVPRNQQEEANSLVFVGSFQHHPNCDAMFYFCSEIMPRVRQQVPSAKLFIVGSRPPGSLVKLSEDPAVKVTGYVEDLRPYLEEAALYIVPLRLGVGIRGKILEAWAMQRPVIATSLACSGLPVQHGKNIWIADSAEDFAAGIVCLLQNRELRKRLGEGGRRTAEKDFGWDVAVHQLESVYYQTLREAGCCCHNLNPGQQSGDITGEDSFRAMATKVEP